MINLTIQIFREGKTYIAHNPELDVSSCANTPEKAKLNLRDAIRGFLKSAQKHGRLQQILESAGFTMKRSKWESPDLIAIDRFSVPV